MSETATTRPKAPLKKTPRRSPHWGVGLLITLSRLLLLGAGIAVGSIAGLAFAQFSPGDIQQAPWLERAISGSTIWFKRVQAASQGEFSPSTAIPDLIAAATADGTLRITLPGDRLFATNSSTLQPPAEELLNNIAKELRSYPRATIRIAAHTDDTGNAERDRDLSFEQAAVVRRSLENNLGQGYSWVTLGHGAGRPVVENTTAENRQRNRRVEIEITPQ